jgi:hypothetical protein
MAYYNRKPAKAQPMIPTVDAVAAACIAFRTNGYHIQKNDIAEDLVISQYNPLPTPAVHANRTLASNAIVLNTITQADRDEAVEVIQHIQGVVTMGLLSGKKVSEFVLEVAKALEENEVPAFKLGLLVYAPNIHYQSKAREIVTEQTTECLYTSQALGAVGDKVTVNFTLIEKRHVQAFDVFSAYGRDDAGNLVSFLSKHEALCASGTVKGTIKKAEADSWHSNAVVTCLNRVKAA